MPSGFAHLHVHTEYSLLDGAARLDDLIAKAVADGQKALGITDHGHLYGLFDFYERCRKAGINPVLGMEAYLAREHRSERPKRAKGAFEDDGGGDVEGGGKAYHHMTILAENNTGYRNLIQLSSMAFLDGYYAGKARADWELLDRYHDGLIATSACLGGHVLQALLRDDFKTALALAGRTQDIFGRDSYFIELQDHGIADQRRTMAGLIDIARKLGAPLLATNDSHYVDAEDHEGHDALLCVNTGAKIADERRFRFDGHQHYLKTAAEMRRLFAGYPEACNSTLWIAERCQVEIEVVKDGKGYHLPNFPIPAGYADDKEYLRHLIFEGARQRFGTDELAPAYAERLSYELSVIEEMGFSSYFLIVWDLIRHAREVGIRSGPGRGSVAGCLAAYCLRIHEIDPIRHDLFFERFLNPSRVTMPDIDMDFEQARRGEMIEYAVERYGRDFVAQVITIAQIKARSAVKDAARVLGLPVSVGDAISKAMPPIMMGRDTPLRYCVEEPTGKAADRYMAGYLAAGGLRELLASSSDAAQVFDVACTLEGLRRSDGIHAAAVVIGDRPLVELVPVQRKASDEKAVSAPIVTQWDMHGAEEIGLVKMDFLGLRNLDVITWCQAMIRARGGAHASFDIDTVPMDDEATYELLRRGDTIGVFQLESAPMRQLLRAIAPTGFDDIGAVLALYRPGPMSAGMHYAYAAYKNGRKEIEYFHPEAAELLAPTFGLMVFQEQLMAVAQHFAGYTLAEADTLRKACGKKQAETMARERTKFVDGCDHGGYGAEFGERLFDTAEAFADYAFNKSHSYSYGLITYQTAYLKANYPVEYMAALLRSVDIKKAPVYLAECRSLGIKVLPPSINDSGDEFSPTPDGASIIFGLSAIRDVGAGVARAIISERDSNGPYASFKDFAQRRPAGCNAKVLQALVIAGAFDSFGHPRRGLSEVAVPLAEALADVDKVSPKKRQPTAAALRAHSFLDGFSIPEVAFTLAETLRIERRVLGAYVSAHPLAGRDRRARLIGNCHIGEVEDFDGQEIVLAGVISDIEVRTTKAGAVMATVTLEDFTGAVAITVFPKTWERFGRHLDVDSIVAVRGRVENDDQFGLKMLASRFGYVPGIEADAPPVTLTFRTDVTDEEVADAMRVIAEHPGDSIVRLRRGADVVELPADYRCDRDGLASVRERLPLIGLGGRVAA